MNSKMPDFCKHILILILSLVLILFTQWIKILKYSDEAAPITSYTIMGLILLGFFAILGLIINKLLRNFPVAFIRDFPILGWTSLASLLFCGLSNEIRIAVQSVDFLSITTPILTYAGISVANRLGDLKSLSWKVAITGIFVFLGTYLGSAILAQIGLILANK